jgi:tetratricopeptide (TPR) repeat protein
VGGGDGGRSPIDHERWYLNDQREFLLRSIEDAEREHDAGDLARDDFDVLMTRDRTRLAEVEAELEALGPDQTTAATAAAAAAAAASASAVEPEAPTRRRLGTWRRVGVVVSCLLILTGAVILVDHALNPAVPGQASSGSITESKAQQIEFQLDEAVTLNNDGEAVPALQLYDKVLSEDPDDPQALAASGWLEWNAGNADRKPLLIDAGRKAETKAIRLAPSFYAGHLYLGLIMFNQDHNAGGAVEQFTKFLSDSLPTGELPSVAGLIAPAYKQANVPLPAKLAAALPVTTTTTTTTTTKPGTPSTSAP